MQRSSPTSRKTCEEKRSRNKTLFLVKTETCYRRRVVLCRFWTLLLKKDRGKGSSGGQTRSISADANEHFRSIHIREIVLTAIASTTSLEHSSPYSTCPQKLLRREEGPRRSLWIPLRSNCQIPRRQPPLERNQRKPLQKLRKV